MTHTGRRGKVYEYERGKYVIGYSTHAYSYCTKSQGHYPSKTVEKGWMEEADLPPCHCGAPQKFGYPAWVLEVLEPAKRVEGLEGIGIGGFRHVQHIEKRSFRLKRQQQAWVQRQVAKYEKKAGTSR